ncbi:MAG: hypothetical protein V2A63_04655 [Patescibacteria group bacterium]
MKKRIFKNRNLLGGILLAFFAVGILATLGYFLFQKYTQPITLGEILPADETLFFAELQLKKNNSAPGQIFENSAEQDLFGLDSLGFAQPETLFGFAQNHIGIAFFGERIDPGNFALVLDVADENSVLQFLQSEAIEGETLANENFRGQKIYYFPASRALAATFFRGNLILAANEIALQNIVTAIQNPDKRVENSAGWRALAAKLNPRANFIFVSSKFLNEFFASKFSGLQKVLAAPLLQKFSAGGANFLVANNEIKIDSRLVLANSAVAEKPFWTGGNIDPALLNFFGAETQFLLANENLEAQLQQFFSQNATLAAIAQSAISDLVKTWFGSLLKASEVEEILAAPNAFSLTETGGLVAVFTGNLEDIFAQLPTANGKIAAQEETVELPDKTAGHELTVENTSPTVEEEVFAGNKIKTIHFPKYALSFAQLDDFAIFATEKDALKKMLSRFVGEEKFLAENPSGENVFFVRLDQPENLLLQSFRFALAGVKFASDGIKIEFSLAK